MRRWREKRKWKQKQKRPTWKKKQQQMLYIKWIVHNQKVKVEPRKLVSSHRLDARAVSDLTCLWNQGREDQWAMLQLVQFRKTFAIVDTSNKCNSWVTLAQRNINGWGSAGRLKPSLWVSTCVSMCIFKRVVFWGGLRGCLFWPCAAQWNEITSKLKWLISSQTLLRHHTRVPGLWFEKTTGVVQYVAGGLNKYEW